MKTLLTNRVTILTDYIKNVLNADIVISQLPEAKLKALPFFLASEYAFGATSFFNRPLVLMFIDPGETSVDKIRKHIDIIQDNINSMVVAVMESVEAYMRKRLIEKKIAFIIANKQMYLPDLLINLKEFDSVKPEPSTTLQPAAQCLLLHHFLSGPFMNKNMKSLAMDLYFAPMTITRAAYNLHNLGLCEIIGTKDKYLSFAKNKKEIWNKALPLLSSPVKRINYYTGWVQDEHLRKSNINALAHYTDINDDPVEYYATTTTTISQLEGANLKKIGKIVGNICVEEWKYDPVLLTKRNEYVDPLSLYLCFKDNKDERVEAALEKLIIDLKW